MTAMLIDKFCTSKAWRLFKPVDQLADALSILQSNPPFLAARASPWGAAGKLQSTSRFHRYALSLGQIPEVSFHSDFAGHALSVPMTNLVLHCLPAKDLCLTSRGRSAGCE